MGAKAIGFGWGLALATAFLGYIYGEYWIKPRAVAENALMTAQARHTEMLADKQKIENLRNQVCK